MKKSLTGRVIVHDDSPHGGLWVIDGLTAAEWEAELADDVMHVIFRDGELFNEQIFSDIRARVLAGLS
jgi:hypothetical protein